MNKINVVLWNIGTNEVLDSKIPSALKKLSTADFKRRVHMEEQQAQQGSRFLKGTQIAHMMYDNLKITGTGEAPLNFYDQPRVHLKNDNLQGFDTNWDDVLLSMTKFPMKMYILDNVYKKQLRFSEELKPLLAVASGRIQSRIKEAAGYSRLIYMVRRHVEQKIRDQHVNARNEDRSLQGAGVWKPKRKSPKTMERKRSKIERIEICDQWTSKGPCSVRDCMRERAQTWVWLKERLRSHHVEELNT